MTLQVHGIVITRGAVVRLVATRGATIRMVTSSRQRYYSASERRCLATLLYNDGGPSQRAALLCSDGGWRCRILFFIFFT